MDKNKAKQWMPVMLSLVFGLFCLQSIVMWAESPETIAERTKTMTKILELNEQQVTRVEKLYKMTAGQAATDRENFKDNPLALIEAAKRRRGMEDHHMEMILQPDQKQAYINYMQERERDNELFQLKEGLQLKPDQEKRVEDIIDTLRKEEKYRRNSVHPNLPGEDSIMGPGASGGMYGGMPGGMRGGMRGSEMAGNRRNRRGKNLSDSHEDVIIQQLKEREAEKAKKIAVVLTPPQKKLYLVILEMRLKELEKTVRNHMEKHRR